MPIITGTGSLTLHMLGCLGVAPVINPCTDLVPELRDMVAEPTAETYTDAIFANLIARYPLVDADGYEPDDDEWTATYDLNAAAANIWARKRAALATQFDFTADGGTFSRSQQFEMAGKMARYYKALSAPRSLKVHIDHRTERDLQSTYWQNPGAFPTGVVNLPEEDEDE